MSRTTYKIWWTVAGFVLIFALVAGLHLLSKGIAASARESNDWLEHTNAVKHSIDDLKIVFEQADLEQREKVSYGGVSNGTSFRPRVWAAFDSVEQLTQANKSQQSRLDSLRKAVGRRFETYDALMRVAESQGTDAAIAQTIKIRTIDDLRQIENEFAAIRNEEWKIYYERADVARAFRQKIGSTGGAMFYLIYVVIAAACYITIKTLCARDKAATHYRRALKAAKRQANEEILLDENLAAEILGILEDSRPAVQVENGSVN